MMRYWLSSGDGQTHGPHTVEELRALAIKGRVTPSSYLCPVGGKEWKLVSQHFPDFFGVLPPPPPVRRQESVADDRPTIGRLLSGLGAFGGAGASGDASPVSSACRVPLIWAVLATFVTFCASCFPAGAVAWFYATRANRMYAAGHVEAGARAERAHWIWIGLSVVLTVITLVLMEQVGGWMWDLLKNAMQSANQPTPPF